MNRLQGMLHTAPAKAVAWLLAGVLVASFVLTRCVPANPDDNTYKQKASQTIEGALSDVATVRQVLERLHGDEMFRSSAITQMRYSQSSLDSGASTFNEVHPPPDLDWLSTKTNNLLSEAQDTANRARIVIERRQVDQYPVVAADLGRLASQLDKLDESVS